MRGVQLIDYRASWDAAWQHRRSKHLCRLYLDLGGYGEARFIAGPAMQPVFELQAKKDLHVDGAIQVTKYGPDWHAGAGVRETIGHLTHVNGGGAVGRGKLSAHMLYALREGMYLSLHASSWFDEESRVVLDLPAKSLQPAMQQFLDCAHTELKVSWQTMSRTRLTYAVDQYRLQEEDRDRLKNLANYVQEDPTIKRIYVDGHTDASGEKQKNKMLSKRRAEEVAAYLRECGLQQHELVVRYHGAEYPVASNDTVARKAQNRRTTVRLERDSQDLYARQPDP